MPCGLIRIKTTFIPSLFLSTLDLDLSINWQTSHWLYHANEKEVMLLAVFRLQAGLERRHRRAYHSLVL